MTSLAMRHTSASVPGSMYQTPLPPIPKEALSGPTDYVQVDVKVTLPNGLSLNSSGRLSVVDLSSRREPAVNCIEQALVAVTKRTLRTLRNSASMVLRSIGH